MKLIKMKLNRNDASTKNNKSYDESNQVIKYKKFNADSIQFKNISMDKKYYQFSLKDINNQSYIDYIKIQTPMVNIKKDIFEFIDNKTQKSKYYLNLYLNHKKFINILINIEQRLKYLIKLATKFSVEKIEELWNSPLKVENNEMILSTRLPFRYNNFELEVFNVNKKLIPIQEITKNKQIICIIKLEQVVVTQEYITPIWYIKQIMLC